MPTSTEKSARAVKDLQEWLPYGVDALGKIEADLKYTATEPGSHTLEQLRYAAIYGEVTKAIAQLREVERRIQTPAATAEKLASKRRPKKK